MIYTHIYIYIFDFCHTYHVSWMRNEWTNGHGPIMFIFRIWCVIFGIFRVGRGTTHRCRWRCTTHAGYLNGHLSYCYQRFVATLALFKKWQDLYKYIYRQVYKYINIQFLHCLGFAKRKVRLQTGFRGFRLKFRRLLGVAEG